MTAIKRKALRELKKNVEKRTPLVERKLAKVGVQPDPAIVFSTAQYYDTLKKLAKK
jgi:hypothetical protein